MKARYIKNDKPYSTVANDEILPYVEEIQRVFYAFEV